MNRIESLLVEIRDLLLLQSSQKDARKRRSKQESLELYTPNFEEAWKNYPRRLGKKAAGKAYHAAVNRLDQRVLSTTPEEKILTSIKEFSEVWPPSRIKREGSFCPHMSTFLNEDRFDDDPAAWGKEESNGMIGGPQWEPTVG